MSEPMSDEPVFYAVDRFEGDIAVLVADDAATLEVDRSELPDGAGPGSVVRVSLSEESGRPDWASAELAEEEAAARLKKAREVLEELKKRDPGGDISL